MEHRMEEVGKVRVKLTRTEQTHIGNFILKHMYCGDHTKNIEASELEITRTEIGTAIHMTCGGCNERVDITDYSCW